MEEKSLLEKLPEEDVTSIAKIIVSLSAQFAERFPFLVIDDCIQVAWRELIQYQSYYTPGLSKVTSWVYKLVKDTLTSYAQKEYNKTQRWDNIEDHVFTDGTVEAPDRDFAYNNLLETLRQVLSPYCFLYLCQLEKNPKICLSELSQNLGLSERDLIYLRDELRMTTQHILEA